ATKFPIAVASRLPLDPDDATQASACPAVQRCQLVQLAEAEISGPSPQQRVQVGDHPIQAYPAMSPCQIAHPVLEPSDGLVGDAPSRLRIVRDREAKERSFPRPGDGTLLRVDLELKTSLDEAGHARHDPVAGLFAADVDVAVVRVTHEAVATTLKLAIQFVQHEIREQRRERAALRGALPTGLEQPVVEHTDRQVASDEPKHPPVQDARCHVSHQSVVIDPVEKFRQVYIDNELIAFGHIGLRLCHRLLDHAINHGWNAEVACPAGRFRDLHPTHRLRLVATLEQLTFDLRPARLQDARELSNGDPVDARRSLVAHYRTQRRFYVVGVTDRLHQIRSGCRAFGFGRRRDHFDLSRDRTRGFTPARHRQVQRELEWRSRCAHETSKLLALSFNPLRGPFGPSTAGAAYYA